MSDAERTQIINSTIDATIAIVKNHSNTEKVSTTKPVQGKHVFYRAISVSKYIRLAEKLKRDINKEVL